VRIESKENASQRLKDALEFLNSAMDNLDKNRFKAALVDAADASIAANDAFTIFMIEQKASTDHREAIAMHKKAGQKVSENRVAILKRLIDFRHKTGYRSVSVSKSLAAQCVADATKFVRWVQEKMSY